MKYFGRLLIIFISLFLLSCQSNNSKQGAEINPAADGFNLEESDARAIAIADQVMEAMGGRSAWDSSRYISWNFFGRRHLSWDKQEHLCRIEIPRDSLTILIDLESGTGKAKQGNIEITHSDSLAKVLKRGKGIWINDSYWLVMPFKLKDSGVTLKYMGQDTTASGAKADVLQLTFAEVGVTPDNKYHVYVDRDEHLVKQWDYYSSYLDTLPRFSGPWLDYKKYGRILLSGNRGRSTLSDIEVTDHFHADKFKTF